MAAGLAWYGPQAVAWIQGELARRLRRAAILVVNRAKELLSIDGAVPRPPKGMPATGGKGPKGVKPPTAAAIGRAAGKVRRARVRAFVKEFNAANKAGISVGAIKRLRVTKAGTVSDRRKAKKKPPQ